MSPEAIETPGNVSTSTDIWSLGAMMYELLTGSRPFGSGLAAVYKIIDAKPPVFPAFITRNSQFSYLAGQLIGLILQCLQKDASSRPSADKLAEECGKLCYPNNQKLTGYVTEINYNAFGWIRCLINGNQEYVFFHLDSVYGEKPQLGDQVWFSKFAGSPYDRAHPVICLKKAQD
jgi:serine/threonine-protein kinase